MSLFIHRCTECGHGSHEHVSGRYCSFGYCTCMIDAGDLTDLPVEELPTFRTGGAVADHVIAPGEKWGGAMGGWSKACECPACHAAYQGRGGVA